MSEIVCLFVLILSASGFPDCKIPGGMTEPLTKISHLIPQSTRHSEFPPAPSEYRHLKRISEIFPTSSVAVSNDNSAPPSIFSPSGPPRHLPAYQTVNSSDTSQPRSPFGAARAMVVPVLSVGGSSLVPPLVSETSAVKDLSNSGGVSLSSGTFRKQPVPTRAKPPPIDARKHHKVITDDSPAPSGGNRPGTYPEPVIPSLDIRHNESLAPTVIPEDYPAPIAVDSETRTNAATLRQHPAGTNSDNVTWSKSPTLAAASISGASTPIASNMTAPEVILQRANALLEAQRNKHPTKGTHEKREENIASNNVSSDIQPLDDDKIIGKNWDESSSCAKIVASSSSSLEQLFNEAIAQRGEKAVAACLSQLSIPTPRGRPMGVDLLSGILPPMTPRGSRSRPSSPERMLPSSIEKNGVTRVKRWATPTKTGDGEDGLDKIACEFIVSATGIIHNEYETDLGTYTVRKPFDELTEDSKFGNLSIFARPDRYRETFDVYNPDSLEVLLFNEADGSIFVLTGKANARHGKIPSDIFVGANVSGEESDQIMPSSLDWEVFEDVEEMDCALGRVTYIDMEGNEREYWLDSIYEDALSIRESYCTSVLSAACALQHATKENISPLNQSTQSVVPLIPHTIPDPRVPENNSGQTPRVSPPELMKSATEPTFVMPPEVLPTQPEPIVTVKHQPSPGPTEKTEPFPHKDDLSEAETEYYEPSDSALSLITISLFSLLFSIVWFFFVRLPFRIFSTALKLCIALLTLRVVWLLLADDNGASEMGAGVNFWYNRPDIY